MSKNVFANGNEISAKNNDNESTAAMPDVCLSPPSPPAGPIPIPYPNTSDASKTDGGSKTVKIGGEEAGLKNKSTYKDSSGDEGATKSLGMGVVTHAIQGKTKFAAWSMDVLIEGENAIRHMDITTHNHGNPPNIALVLSKAKRNKISDEKTCDELQSENKSQRNSDTTGAVNDPETGFTSTTATYTNPGKGGLTVSMKAISRQSLVKKSKRKGYAKSRSGVQKRACTSSSAGGGRMANHTEPKIIEQIFQAARTAGAAMPVSPPGLGKLMMNVYHKPPDPARADANPCTSCEKEICAAVGCGLEITLCVNGNKKKPNCKGGKPGQGSFMK